MEPLLIYPESAAQIKAVKSSFESTKIQFETYPNTLPPHILKIAEEGIKQRENEQTISLEEFKERHFSKNKFRKFYIIISRKKGFVITIIKLIHLTKKLIFL